MGLQAWYLRFFLMNKILRQSERREILSVKDGDEGALVRTASEAAEEVPEIEPASGTQSQKWFCLLQIGLECRELLSGAASGLPSGDATDGLQRGSEFRIGRSGRFIRGARQRLSEYAPLSTLDMHSQSPKICAALAPGLRKSPSSNIALPPESILFPVLSLPISPRPRA